MRFVTGASRLIRNRFKTALATLHEQYVRCGIRDRDDTGYMKSIDPGYEFVSPRW